MKRRNILFKIAFGGKANYFVVINAKLQLIEKFKSKKLKIRPTHYQYFERMRKIGKGATELSQRKGHR